MNLGGTIFYLNLWSKSVTSHLHWPRYLTSMYGYSVDIPSFSGYHLKLIYQGSSTIWTVQRLNPSTKTARSPKSISYHCSLRLVSLTSHTYTISQKASWKNYILSSDLKILQFRFYVLDIVRIIIKSIAALSLSSRRLLPPVPRNPFPHLVYNAGHDSHGDRTIPFSWNMEDRHGSQW